MPVILHKGESFVLKDVCLSKIRLGLGWKPQESKGAPFDLDASVFLREASDKVRRDTDFIYYHRLESTCGEIKHGGDHRTGDENVDNETIHCNLEALSEDIVSVSIVASIYEAKRRWQTFDRVDDAYIRIVDEAQGKEILRYALHQEAGLAVCVHLGDLVRLPQGGWQFHAVGEGYSQDLKAVAKKFGVKALRVRKKNETTAIHLQKGQNVSLSKESPGLKTVRFGLGWDVSATDNADFDLDASALILGNDDKVLSDLHFVFYNNSQDPSGAVSHSGDNQTGEGAGDDENLLVDLSKMPIEAKKVVFVVTIHEAEARRQNFGQIDNAYIRALNADNNSEIARYELTSEARAETAMIFGELYRHTEGWKFRAVGQDYAGGLAKVAKDFGVNIS